MSIIVLVSIIVRIAAVLWCLRLMRTLGDRRFVLPAIMLALMAARQAGTLLSILPEHTGLAIGAAWEIPSLVVSAIALITAVYLGKSQAAAATANAELVHSEQHYRNLFELSPDSVAVVGINENQKLDKVIDVNQHTLDTLGYERDELVGHSIAEFDLHSSELEERAAIVLREGGMRFETEWLAKDGTYIPSEVSVTLSTMNVKPVVLGASRNLAPERAAARELEVANLRFGQLLESIDQGFYLYELDTGKILYSSPAWERISGISADAVMADPALGINATHPDDLPRLLATLTPAAQGKPIEEFEYRIVRPDGGIRWLATRNFLISHANDASDVLAGVITDITQRKQSHDALIAANKELADAHRIAGIGSGEVDMDAGRVTMSKAAVEMFGLPSGSSSFDRDEIADLVHIDDRAHVMENLREILESSKSATVAFECRMNRRNGTVFWASVICEQIVDEDTAGPSSPRLRGTLQDISERKRFEEVLRSLATVTALTEEHERHRLAAALHDGAVQNLGLCRVQLGQLRHEMTTQPQLSEQIDAIVNLVDATIRDTRNLLSDISPPVLTELGLVAAMEWLADEVEARSHLAMKIRSRVRTTELSKDLEVIMFQTVRELVANVEKHARASIAEVDLTNHDGVLRLRVKDDGCGLPERLELKGPTEDGGYGLFSIRERLRLLGGTIDIAGREDGTTVEIELPLASADALLTSGPTTNTTAP